MQLLRLKISKKGTLAFAASLLTLGMVIAGCTSAVTSTSSTSNIIPNTNTSTTPVGITDAVNNQVLATSLTLNSIILTDSTGKVTTNLLAAGPITFEAAHLDAVQEPFFSAAIPEDTNPYVSVTLTYSNAQVAYVNTATTPASIVLDSTPTLANTSKTVTFASPITISNTTTSLLVDYLVTQSVAISGCTASGCTVTVTPDFDVTAIAISATPTNGTNGLMTHKGIVKAISASTDSFTITNPSGTSLTIYVNANTVFQPSPFSNVLCMGVSCLTELQVNALVEVDTITQNGSTALPKGSLLATRVEVDDTGVTAPKLLLGPVTSRTPTATGTAATSFDMVLRQMVGGTSAAALESVDVTVTGTTNFLMPPRFTIFATALPFTPSFTASTIFAGQHVAVVTTSIGVTSGAATATTVLLQPQTVSGTINSCTTSQIAGAYAVCTITMPADHWLAKLTGQTTVLVYINSLAIPINATAPTVGNTMRFNGYLFNVGGTLRLVTVVQADPPGTPILAGASTGPTI
jgi:hypothetical protein